MRSLWIVVGLIVAVTDFIPIVGSAVGVILPPLLLALNAEVGLIRALIALPVFAVKQVLKDSVLEPIVVGNRRELLFQWIAVPLT